MSSILTNNGAMVALNTLKSINSNLSKVQDTISTGKEINSAKDNASVWAISKVMEADVKGFQGISDSLSLAESSVSVASGAAETVTDLLTDIKSKIVSAQEENVDREKIQADIKALTEQIKSVTGAAQFNGLNLLEGTEDVEVLSSLDRASDGTVKVSNIAIARQDLSTSAGTYGSGAVLDSNATIAGGATSVGNTGNTAKFTFAGSAADYESDEATVTVAGVELKFTGAAGQTEADAATFFSDAINALGLEGVTASATAGELTVTSTRAFEGVGLAISGLTGDAVGSEISELNGSTVSATSGEISERAESIAFSTGANVNEGDGYKVTIGSSSYSYVAGKGETMEDIAKGLKTAIDSAGLENVSTEVVQDETTGQWSLKIDNDDSAAALDVHGNADGEASGGLYGLDNIDVSTAKGAAAALENIDTLIANAVDATAAFGSSQGRLETQSEFVSKLTSALQSGIGSLVDADMEETSARLQALQVQQQLGVQSLSMANQAPQSILSLFG